MAKTPQLPTVSTFKHPRSFGFTASAGDIPVIPHMRSPAAKPVPKDMALAVRKPGGFRNGGKVGC